MKRELALVLVLGCGGATASLPDASNESGADSTVDDATNDVPPTDAGEDRYPGFVIVDGGHDCDLPDSRASAAYNTCCRGAVCAGQCMQWLDGGDPFCGCAGLTTGCPGGYLCCPGDNPEGTCVSECPRTGTN